MSFEERHAQIDENPAVELRRRLQPWAAAPSSRGEALKPDAVIVPRETVEQAAELLEKFYEIIKTFERAKTKGSA